MNMRHFAGSLQAALSEYRVPLGFELPARYARLQAEDLVPWPAAQAQHPASVTLSPGQHLQTPWQRLAPGAHRVNAQVTWQEASEVRCGIGVSVDQLRESVTVSRVGGQGPERVGLTFDVPVLTDVHVVVHNIGIGTVAVDFVELDVAP